MMSIVDFCNSYYMSSIAIFIGFLFVVVLGLWYLGAFFSVNVCVAKPPFNHVIIAYKFTPSIPESRTLLSEVQKLAPRHDSFAMYHEEFATKSLKSNVGSTVGVILSDNSNTTDAIVAKLCSANYKISSFPKIDYAIMATFPYRNSLSALMAVYRVYPQIKRFTKQTRSSAHPIIELYKKDKIYFIAPLSKQIKFYVKEALPCDTFNFHEDDHEFGTDVESDSEGIIDYNCSCIDPSVHDSCSCDFRKRAV